MFKRILIKLLLKILSPKVSYANIKPELINSWLRKQSTDRGWYEYFKMRDYQILKEIGSPSVKKWEDYKRLLGNRTELLILNFSINDAVKKQNNIIKDK